jgi:PEP-CTERM motif
MKVMHSGRKAAPWARFVAAAVVALAIVAVDARADVVYDLSGVTFSDGTTATGTFTTDNTLTSLLTYDITTTNGAIAGFEYTPATAGSSSTSLPGIIVLEPADLSHIIELTFNGGLQLAGAPILIGDFDSFEQDINNVHRQVVSGSVVNANSVPEPSSLALGGISALAGLALRATRRKRAA